MQGTPPGSASRVESREDGSARGPVGRQVSSSIQRQLFTGADDPPPLSARGLNRHTSEPSQGMGLTSMSTAGAVTATVRVVSAAPPRPSPRGAPQTAAASTTPGSMQAFHGSLRSHSQGASVAASPRGAKAIAAMQGLQDRIDNRPAVRAIVNEFERRSTSQTPGPSGCHRNFDTSITPGRGATNIHLHSARAVSANAPGASSRAPSHGPQLPAAATARGDSRGRRHPEDAEEIRGSPSASEDRNTSAVVFGMSPMNRPRSDRAPVHHVRGGISTPSPQPKGPSVQDRIRVFQPQR